MWKKTHYEVLNLEKNCTKDDIKKAFIRLSKENHPDKNCNTADAHNKFVLINEAYSTLINPKKRHMYDLTLSKIREFKNSGSYHYPYSEPKNNEYRGKYSGSGFFVRLILLPQLFLVAALLVVAGLRGNVERCFLGESYNKKKELQLNKDTRKSLLIKYIREQVNKDETEEQLRKFEERTLGIRDIKFNLEELKKFKADTNENDKYK